MSQQAQKPNSSPAELTLILKLKSVYGRDLIYPINDTAIKIAALLKKKTFDTNDLTQLQNLGYRVHWEASHPNFPLGKS